MRREFIAGLTGAVAVPLVAEAQQAGMPIIGYLGSESPERYGIRLEAFTQGLSAMVSLKYAVPAVMAVREFAVTGGLLSYGGDIRESHRQAGIYTGRILKGEKPADLAVQQVTKLQLVINLRTAKALGIAVSLPLLGRAYEVIE